VLLTAQPVEVEGTVVLPCPLLKRMETADTSIWIRQLPAETWATFGQAPRVMLAHGSVQAFGSAAIDGEAPNQIDLEQLPKGELDYVALGDWHGVKKVAHPKSTGFPRVWATARAFAWWLQRTVGQRQM
jgi:hypothetical protein